MVLFSLFLCARAPAQRIGVPKIKEMTRKITLRNLEILPFAYQGIFPTEPLAPTMTSFEGADTRKGLLTTQLDCLNDQEN